ncbi:hypothetical protein KIN_29420 [Litoreibacter roseus]|uniref:Uncharacterized protein n=2 Tax=Litoreibacter roseus TaxID=2601869 RepID=A0A6N6JKS0_9RHOB|nr:hypothetical protein KIN_29420 [Litoreibacter roseus]
MFGDGSVKLPSHIARPSHWPAAELSGDLFEQEYKKWREDPEPYIPPEKPYKPQH